MTSGRRVLARYLTKQALIPVPPRNVGRLLDSVVKRLGQSRRMTEIAQTIYRKAEDINGYSYFTREADVEASDLKFWAEAASRLGDSLQRNSYGKDVRRLLDSISDFEEKRRFFHFAQTMTTAKMDQIADDAGLDADALALFKEYLELSKMIINGVQLLKEKLEVLRDAPKMDDYENAGLPKHEKIETVYHASIYAHDLYRHGFKESRPVAPDMGGLGLGGSVEDKAGNDAISFTYDPKYALEIARWFKEVAMVHAGEIKPQQIMRWAQQEGVAEKTLDMFRGLYPACHGHSTIEGVTCLGYENGRWVVTYEKYDPKTNRNVTTYDGDIDLIFHSKEQVYGFYLAFLTSNPHRENPVGNMSALLRTMERMHVDPKGIGVIVAEVDMSDPDILHKPAERELRVPVKAIRKVVKFIGS